MKEEAQSVVVCDELDIKYLSRCGVVCRLADSTDTFSIETHCHRKQREETEKKSITNLRLALV